MILSITLNPCIDRTVFLSGLKAHDANRVVRTEIDAGGKGVNLSRVVGQLGAETVALGFLGGDSGEWVQSALTRQGVRTDFVKVAGETRMNVSIESGDGPPTSLNERGPQISPQEWEALIQSCRKWAPRASWACIGGSMPPGVPEDGFATLVQVLREGGCKVVLDADGEPMRLGLAAKPDLIKPNDREASRLLGRVVAGTEAAVEAARELRESGIPWVVVSLGGEGAVLSCPEGDFVAPAVQVEVRSTVGSGDSLIGGMVWALESGLPADQAFAWGLAAGAATAMTDGSSIANRDAIHELRSQAMVKRVP